MLATSRGYLRPGVLLIKPVAAATGDIACRHGQVVTINRAMAARARVVDAHGRQLPVWYGCRRLRAGQVFVLSGAPGSFDSRYLGVIDASQILGSAKPLWVEN
jgi:type IV secretory pathway protease TraF